MVKHVNTDLQQMISIIKSGEPFKVSGFYKIPDHDEKSFVPSSAYFMLFRSGQIASKLAFCKHEVCWKLIIPFGN